MIVAAGRAAHRSREARPSSLHAKRVIPLLPRARKVTRRGKVRRKRSDL